MFKSSILAGMFIAVAGMLYLIIGGIEGAILFSVGLLGVVIFNAHLFTGKAGFVSSVRSVADLFGIILIGNVIGVMIVAGLLRLADYNVSSIASGIIESRINSSMISCFVKGIFCGLLMTTAVYGVKEKNTYLPLLFSIPAFILCGFYHSIADCFYFSMIDFSNFAYVEFYLPRWVVIVLGNFIGCNLPNLLRFRSMYNVYN